MPDFDYRLNVFSSYAKDVKTSKELCDAIEKLGPLPRYWSICVNSKQKDDICDFESAKKEAQAVYEHARGIAINLRKSEQIHTPLPPPQDNPFLGIQTIKEWCIDASKKQPKDGSKAEDAEKPTETEQNATCAKCWRTWTCVKEIPRWIYYLVGFLAALLTCLYLLGWLKPN